MRPTNHLELSAVENQQWLDVQAAGSAWARLFTARVSRLDVTYTFTSRLFVRGISPYVSTDRDPRLYLVAVAARSGDFNGSILIAY